MEELGSSAPEFSLLNTNPTVGGQTVSMTAMNEQPALLVAFICNHCPYVIHIRDAFLSFASEMLDVPLRGAEARSRNSAA